MASQQQQAQALGDPTRYAIFEYIRVATEPVAIAELVELLGFNHNAIRQHIAKLLTAELVVEQTEKRTTRGRPRQLYEARTDALDAFAGAAGSYEWLSQQLLELHQSGDTPYEVGRRAGAATAAEGSSIDDLTALTGLLQRGGFRPDEPVTQPDGESTMILNHCPFAEVASKAPDIVCEFHRGVIDGHLGAASPTAKLDVADAHSGGCVVRVSLGDTST